MVIVGKKRGHRKWNGVLFFDCEFQIIGSVSEYYFVDALWLFYDIWMSLAAAIYLRECVSTHSYSITVTQNA